VVLDKLVGEVCLGAQTLGQAKSITIAFHPQVSRAVVHGDDGRLRQLFLILPSTLTESDPLLLRERDPRDAQWLSWFGGISRAQRPDAVRFTGNRDCIGAARRGRYRSRSGARERAGRDRSGAG
jgi:hypothetical protein